MLSSERNVIFLSHATPEDNGFTIWLASRLQAEGFEVWIDKQALLGGEKFWQDIDQVIRHRAIKFLLVYSENICSQKQRGILRDGIYKEKSLAESIAKDNKLDDFIILLNLDGSEYNLFIGADALNQIHFFDNWASGYNQLLKKFKKDELKSSNTAVGNFSRWYEDEYVIHNGIEKLHEIYYDSWWPIPDLPQSFYIYVLENDTIASQIQQHSKYPVSKISNIVTTFQDVSNFEISFNDQDPKINFLNKYKLIVNDVIHGIPREGFPSIKDTENHFKSLLQRIFHIIMKERGLSWHMMANKKLAYFFSCKTNPKIKFRYSRRSRKIIKRKNIWGKYRDGIWHFALSAQPILHPQLAFSLKSHIVFTKDGYKLWDDKNKMHTARRRKGRLMFNEEWRDMLLAFLHALCQKSSSVRTNLSPSSILSLRPWTNVYESDFGYHEPKGRDRYSILDVENERYDPDEDLDGEVDDVYALSYTGT